MTTITYKILFLITFLTVIVIGYVGYDMKLIESIAMGLIILPIAFIYQLSIDIPLDKENFEKTGQEVVSKASVIVGFLFFGLIFGGIIFWNYIK